MNLKSSIAILFLVPFVAVGCGGRAANPVMTQQYGDDKRSCEALEKEMIFIQQEIQRLVPETQKNGKNVALGVAGAFLLIPWFFMDLSQAEQEEVNAYRQRYNNLSIIATDKQCTFNTQPMPDFTKPPAQAEEEKSQFPGHEKNRR